MCCFLFLNLAYVLNAEKLSFLYYSHSDTNLVELGGEAIKEDDRAVLLEGGLTRSASSKTYGSSIKANLIRLFYKICYLFIEFLLYSVITGHSKLFLCMNI